MKERPILFSAPMVRAILNGTKTQTRRVCKNKVYGNGFHYDGRELLCHSDYLPPSALLMDYKSGGHDFTTSNLEGWGDACPYGQPGGDRLWVRETFADLHGTGIEHRPDTSSLIQRYAFAADTPSGSYGDQARKDFGVKWKPSIHMPRAASRITLEVTDVRVERLQEISEADARAEGAPPSHQSINAISREFGFPDFPRSWYGQLWEQINGTGSWDANPWVWVIEFKRVKP